MGADCFGGATLVPHNGWWHSAADSDNIVSCPNTNACQRNNTALLVCQAASYWNSYSAALDQVWPN